MVIISIFNIFKIVRSKRNVLSDLATVEHNFFVQGEHMRRKFSAVRA